MRRRDSSALQLQSSPVPQDSSFYAVAFPLQVGAMLHMSKLAKLENGEPPPALGSFQAEHIPILVSRVMDPLKWMCAPCQLRPFKAHTRALTATVSALSLIVLDNGGFLILYARHARMLVFWLRRPNPGGQLQADGSRTPSTLFLNGKDAMMKGDVLL